MSNEETIARYMGFKLGKELEYSNNWPNRWKDTLWTRTGGFYERTDFTTDWNWMVKVLDKIGDYNLFKFDMDTTVNIVVARINSLNCVSGTWLEVGYNYAFLKDGRTFLTRNDHQGGTLKLVWWDLTHRHYKSEDGPIIHTQWTHVMHIPE